MTGGRLRGDHGAATTETVLVAPVLIFMILLIVQLGLCLHAVGIASAAAQDGARDASLAPASVAEGEATARGMLDSLAPDLLAGATVTGQLVDGGENVRMTVNGPVSQVVRIPGIDLSITVNETAETPVEEFRPADDLPAAPPA
jgi:Flp pilus assembly protein TadG